MKTTRATLEAHGWRLGTAAAVDACWIAGSFDAAPAAAYIDLNGEEQVRAVTPLGYGTRDVRGFERRLNTVVKPRGRLELERIAPGALSWPEWAREAAEAVRLAPSGQNRQPWRQRMDDGSLRSGCSRAPVVDLGCLTQTPQGGRPMSTREKLIRARVGMLALAEELQNISLGDSPSCGWGVRS